MRGGRSNVESPPGDAEATDPLLRRGLVPAIEIRPRRATELVDAGFQLLRRFYPQMFTLAAIAMAPSVILRALFRDSLSDPNVMVQHPAPFIIVTLVAMVCSTVADAVLIVTASEGYLTGTVELSNALGKGFRRLFYVLVAMVIRYVVLVALVLVIGATGAMLAAAHLQVLLIVVVPAGVWAFFYVILRTFAMSQAVLLEDANPFASLSRSVRLSEACAAHVFFTLCLVWLLYFVMYFVALGVAMSMLSRTIAEIIAGVVIVAIYPLIATVTTLLYYDLRVRKEGFDLEVMARELGGTVMDPGAMPATGF